MDWSKIWFEVEKIEIDINEEEYLRKIIPRKKGQIVINLPKRMIEEKE